MRIFLVAMAIMLSTSVFAEDITSVKYTSRIWAGFLYNMIINLGPENDFKKPAISELNKSPKKKTDRKKSFRKRPKKKSKPKIVKPVFKSEVLKYSGKQMWGTANITIRTNEISFDVRVKSTLPVTMWTIYSGDKTELDSSRINSTESFSFNVDEFYTPPYTIYLKVVYMNMPNLIKIDIKE